jgi:hypothetical protein
MAVADTTITTAGSTLAKLWRKVQGNLLVGFKSSTEEYGWVKDGTKTYEIDASAREITAPIDIVRQGGASFIPEGGYEARPGTNAPQEVTLTWSNLTQSFTVTDVANLLDKRNRNVEIQRQMKYQVLKAIESVSRRVGQSFYGYSTGVVAKTSTNATQASGEYTLIDAYGESTLDGAAYLARFFAVGDYVALIRSAALVTNAIGSVTAVNETTGTITVTWAGSVDSDAGDSIVFANSRENTTIAGTDYLLWPYGLLDGMKSTSLEGLSGGDYPNWTVARGGSGGGRFNSVTLRKMRQAVKNRSGLKTDMLIWSQGVENDVFENSLSARRFNESIMDLDGAVKTKEEQRTSERVLPGYAIVGNSGAMRKFTLQDRFPDEDANAPAFMDGDKLQDRKARQFSVDISYAFVWTNRGGFAYESGLTEQAP